MIWHESRSDEPPLEAYSRVTNPVRFLALHWVATDQLERLEAEYDVVRSAAFDLPPEMEPFEQVRAPLRLTPVESTAAPISVAFTPFPSLLVRCGRWLVESFPSCGCDACAETAESESERLQLLLDDVVAGLFREKITIPLLGRATHEWRLGDGTPVRRSCWRVVARSSARKLVARGAREVQWQPWVKRRRA